MTRILVFPPLMILALIASVGDSPLDPAPPPVRVVVVALDARIVHPEEGEPYLVIVATGVVPTAGYSEPKLVALPGRTLAFELVATPPVPEPSGGGAETVLHATLRLPVPERMPAVVRVVQPERFVSRHVD